MTKNRVVLLTGANGNLGNVLLDKLVDDGNLIYAAVHNSNENKYKNNKIKKVKLDVTSEIECKSLIDRIIKEQGKIDVLINNAAITLSGQTLDFSVNDFKRVINVNTFGPFLLMKYALPQMKKQKSGKFINITSLNGLVSLPNFGIYSASKHAIEALSQAVRYELKGTGISVTTVAPGAIKSTVKSEDVLSHKPLRERYWIFQKMFPMITKEEVARKVCQLVKSDNPPARVLIGIDTIVSVMVDRLIPSYIKDKLIKNIT